MPRFAVSAYLTALTHTGYNYRLMLDVVVAPNHEEARAHYAIRAKDAWPEHGLNEVLAVEIVDEQTREKPNANDA